eukprot:scpid40810/ scgid30538/ 
MTVSQVRHQHVESSQIPGLDFQGIFAGEHRYLLIFQPVWPLENKLATAAKPFNSTHAHFVLTWTTQAVLPATATGQSNAPKEQKRNKILFKSLSSTVGLLHDV